MNKPKLEKCPFCGKSDSVLLLEQAPHLYYVCCTGQKGGCGARTTLCEKEITAVVTWNGRAPLPDNKVLTMDEQREMDGQPVWCEELQCYGLISVENGGKWAGMPFLIGRLRQVDIEYDIQSRGLSIYRRPLEKEE